MLHARNTRDFGAQKQSLSSLIFMPVLLDAFLAPMICFGTVLNRDAISSRMISNHQCTYHRQSLQSLYVERWKRSLLLLVATKCSTIKTSLQDPRRYFHLESHNSEALNVLFPLIS
jgi:hypothetical protein